MKVFAGIFVTLIFISRLGLAAEFSVEQNGILIAGEIKRGDFDRLLEFIPTYNLKHKNKLSGDYYFLDSPGGDVEEALKIGSYLSKNYSSVILNKGSRCFSACTIIFAGGVQRLVFSSAKLGFHRMSFSRKEIDVEKTKNEIDLENKKVIDFFNEVGFPTVLITKMNETSPTDIYIVDVRWLIEHELDSTISFQPYFLDVVEKNCGANPSFATKHGQRMNVTEIHAAFDWEQCLKGVRDANQVITFNLNFA